MRRNILTSIVLLFVLSVGILSVNQSCAPNQGTKADQESLQQDSVNVQEGKGEGDLGEGEIQGGSL